MRTNKIDTVENQKKKSILERDISGLMDKATFILRRSIFFILALPLLITIVVSSPLSYKTESELVFEECTFIKYEYEYNDRLRGSDYEEYHIYVEEYDDYLILSGSIFDDVNVSVLSDLRTGDKITLSINNNLGTKFLYSLSYGDRSILSYDDYLSASYKSDKRTHQLCTFGIIFALPFPLIEVIYKKVKGKSLYWPDENDTKAKPYNTQNHSKQNNNHKKRKKKKRK